MTESLKHDRKAPERRCIVTREVLPKETLVRFVIGPDGVLTPDLANKLPGRGYWVRCQREMVEQAIKDRGFIKVAKEKVTVPETMAETVERLLEARALQALALANKAGALIQGFDKVSDALQKKRVLALVHAEDASEASLHKLPFEAKNRFRCFRAEALSAKLGAENAVHLAILTEKAGESAVKEIRRFTGFLQKRPV